MGGEQDLYINEGWSHNIIGGGGTVDTSGNQVVKTTDFHIFYIILEMNNA